MVRGSVGQGWQYSVRQQLKDFSASGRTTFGTCSDDVCVPRA